MTSTPQIASPLAPKARLSSLDQFRGYTVAGMFFVNYIGGFHAIHDIWKHHHDYCSYADTIMPQFMFAVGFAFQLTVGKQLRQGANWAAYQRILRRLIGLALIAIIVYPTSGDRFPTFEQLKSASWLDIFGEPLKRTWFQTLMHIAVTTAYVLPVIGRSALVRIIYMSVSGLLHVILSYYFYFEWVNTGPNGIDGGPLGFLTWSIPFVVGTLCSDVMTGPSSPISKIAKLFFASLFLMGLGYLISCPTRLYDTTELPSRRLAVSPVWPTTEGIKERKLETLLAEPPFIPPPPAELKKSANVTPPTVYRPWNYWMMSQRAGTLSYLVFSAGFSVIVYLVFYIASDLVGLKVGVFRTLGTNALIGYIAHDLVGTAVKPFAPNDSPWIYAIASFWLFFLLIYLFCRSLEKQGIYVRM